MVWGVILLDILAKEMCVLYDAEQNAEMWHGQGGDGDGSAKDYYSQHLGVVWQ